MNIAVLISDIHYSEKNLDLCNSALIAARNKAKELGVPLIIAGDLLDTKAIIRGECMNALINIFKDWSVKTYVIPGNHDMLNAKGTQHSLGFLSLYVTLIDTPKTVGGFNFIPYQSTSEAFVKALHLMPKDKIVIAHQGIKGAWLGDYVQDKSSVEPRDCEGYKIISGHYHRAQRIACGTTGSFEYLGSPFTHTFTEATNRDMGYSLLDVDENLKKIPLNLRKHIVIETEVSKLDRFEGVNLDDLVWLKIKGKKSDLAKLTKESLSKYLCGHLNFKLDKIPTDSISSPIMDLSSKPAIGSAFDQLIDRLQESDQYKLELKKLWRKVI